MRCFSHPRFADFLILSYHICLRHPSGQLVSHLRHSWHWRCKLWCCGLPHCSPVSIMPLQNGNCCWLSSSYNMSCLRHYMVIILSDNYSLPLPVLAFTLLTSQLTRLTAHTRSAESRTEVTKDSCDKKKGPCVTSAYSNAAWNIRRL